MSKSDNKFVNLSYRYELKDWLYRNDFSKKESNVDELIDIINNKVKKIISLAAFFKIVAIICLLIKQLLFLDLGGLHQLVHSS